MLARIKSVEWWRQKFVRAEHKWGTITSKWARWSESQHWGACARRTAFGHAGVQDGVAAPEKVVCAYNPQKFSENLLSKSCFLLSGAPKSWPLLGHKALQMGHRPLLASPWRHHWH